MNKYLERVTLNVNRLNALIKDIGQLNRKENMTFIYAVYKTLTSEKNGLHRLKVKG